MHFQYISHNLLFFSVTVTQQLHLRSNLHYVPNCFTVWSMMFNRKNKQICNWGFYWLRKQGLKGF
ncbi:hypothetical protein HanXRQr2_Chr14g0665581 [Helianthus annuus]|uniref:Uncharacterized protein n=1 Tax=Helianthus annuus TaxID=4232 RepID=A0A9K3EE91_HELAN|nr:hypothetical protein HanXRQr2_Chr14g0665581 [Helianthus annuus]KAJ0470768.1 hypothetical protein HanIR_Chr14g0722331 [Helianthus annuus]KAJ0842176.1 hypothetical protein HanPSC8_Chr14g0638701 [Helianthus annuus]